MSESAEAPAPEAAPAAAEVEIASPSWTEGLAEDAQGYVENKGWKGADQMLDSYRNLEKAMGAPGESVLTLPKDAEDAEAWGCLLYTSPSPRDAHESRMPSSA